MKKKIRLFAIIMVFVLGIASICYLNRTISGDYISKMLKENSVTKITFERKNWNETFPTKVLSKDETDDFLQLLEETEFKIIRSDRFEVTDWAGYWINCYNSKDERLATMEVEGLDFMSVQSQFLNQERIKYRVKSENWKERLDSLS